MTRIAILALLLTACGVSEHVPRLKEIITLPPDSTAADLLASSGPPCFRTNEGSMEVWAYCTMPCKHDKTTWCVDECLQDCLGWWRAWVVGGYVTRTEAPPPLETP